MEYCFTLKPQLNTGSWAAVAFFGNALTFYDTALAQGTVLPLLTPSIPSLQWPPGFYTMGSLYGKYRILASKFRVDYIGQEQGPQAAIPNTAHFLWVLPIGSAQAFTGSNQLPDSVATLPYTKRRLVCGYNFRLTPFKIQHYMTTRKIDGIPKSQTMTEEYSANTNGGHGLTPSVPNHTWAWVLGFNRADNGNFAGAATADNLTFRVEITYYTEFYSRTQNTLGTQ